MTTVLDDTDAAAVRATLGVPAVADIAVLPVGMLVPYASSTAPSGWLLCYGQAVSRTTYSDLFTVIGTTYGTGDGSTTFNLPDMRGRVAAGKDDMGGTSADRLTDSTTNAIDGDTLGATGGHEIHTLAEAELPSHSHELLTGVAHDGSGGSFKYGTGASSTGDSTGDTGSDADHNNVQPTIILNYIIKT